MTGHDLQKMPSGWRYCVTDITENTSIAKKGLSLWRPWFILWERLIQNGSREPLVPKLCSSGPLIRKDTCTVVRLSIEAKVSTVIHGWYL